MPMMSEKGAASAVGASEPEVQLHQCLTGGRSRCACLDRNALLMNGEVHTPGNSGGWVARNHLELDKCGQT
jgi:hypothetical protein